VPIYEYECESCGHRLEALQRISEDPLTTCPECGGELKRLISAPAFRFKGSGWYVTDYGGKRPGSEAKSGEAKGSGGETADSKGSTGSSEAKDKPAAKSDKE
jgi:putative FmdB family regulatory protein